MELQVDNIYQISNRLISHVNLKYKRSLYSRINWDNRLIGIKGPKGVGKTTLMLQHIKEAFADLREVLYVSMDNIWFANNTLEDLVQYHYTHGGKAIFLDEIHKYKGWQTSVKNIYDSYPDLKIVYSGSSILKLKAADPDLSRRLRSYDLYGLSFREFLEYKGLLEYRILSLDEILADHVNICLDITGRIKILPEFEEYCHQGYFPYFKEEGDGFGERLKEAVLQTIDWDIPAVENVEYSTCMKLKKLLMILASQVPFIPKMNELYQQLETNREQGLKLLTLLNDAQLIGTMSKKAKAFKHLSSPDKMFLDNPNMLYALSERVETGTARETFFRRQLSCVAGLSLPEKGDFKVDDKYLFEIGGPKKSFEQIRDMPDSFVAADGIETGHGNKIPLWIFGFLY